jgi:outer membrane immunogenic protein
MSKTVILLALVAGASIVAQPGRAADFTGLRIEARAGHDRVSVKDSYPDIPNRLSGATLGATLGYDRAIGDKTIVGVEATALASAAKDSTLLNKDKLELGSNRDFDLMVRVGRKTSANTLVYAKAGYAYSRFSFAYESFLGDAYDVATLHDHQDGLRLAAGIEHAFSDKVFGSAEYRHTDYSGFQFNSDATRGQVLFGLGLRF